MPPSIAFKRDWRRPIPTKNTWQFRLRGSQPRPPRKLRSLHTKNPIHPSRERGAGIALLLDASLVLVVPAVAQPAAVATVSACVAKKGTVKILKGKAKCRRGETKISWASGGVGTPGPRGPGRAAGTGGHEGR